MKLEEQKAILKTAELLQIKALEANILLSDEERELQKKEDPILQGLRRLKLRTSQLKEDFYQIAQSSEFWLTDSDGKNPAELIRDAAISLDSCFWLTKTKLEQQNKEDNNA